jgi:hypothetical protein
MKGRLSPRADLDGAQRAAMLELMQEHFVGVTAEQFDRDLAEKDWVILLEDEQRRLRGFSTLLVYRTSFGGAPVRVLYSGDTIVGREAWGSNALARAWLAAARQWLAESEAPLYWLLITSGFRTYRFLPVFWREFWPRFEASRPPALLAFLARERFGGRFDPATGLVRLAEPQVLRNGLAVIPPGRLADPHVAFFARANPGHAAGDELACLCPIGRANQSAIGRKLVPM